MTEQLRVLVFTKAPIPGQVKTRLIPALGADGACALHRELVENTLERLKPLHSLTELWCAPDGTHAFFSALRERFGIALRTQVGDDLGARMHHALSDALARGYKAILTGTDAPMLDHQWIADAYEQLHTHPAVFAPAEDGGYALVGLSRPMPFLFEDMVWGRSDVMAVTRRRLTAAGIVWRELPPVWDLDRPEDLTRYVVTGD